MGNIVRGGFDQVATLLVLDNWALSGLAWVQIKSATVEVDRGLEVLDVAEATGHALDLYPC